MHVDIREVTRSCAAVVHDQLAVFRTCTITKCRGCQHALSYPVARLLDAPRPTVWGATCWELQGLILQLKNAEGYDERAKTSAAIRSCQSKLCKHLS